MASIHTKNLADICRVCGERLQKSKKAVTSKFLCMKWKDFLAEKFEIFVEKDLEEIHPQYFCHSFTGLSEGVKTRNIALAFFAKQVARF